MAAELVLAPEAEADISAAYDWYETQRVGLGEEFVSCLEAGLQQISRFPTIHANCHKEFRRCLIRRFPYVVFYGYESEVVTIYCVFHASRNPDRWRDRLG